MKHTVDNLLDIAHRHHPRGIPSTDASYKGTPEALRLAAARCQAGAAGEAWRTMLRRASERFPDNSVQNRSLHLPTGNWDACYSAAFHFPDRHWLGLLVSFLVPYYIVYSSRVVDDSGATEARRALAADRGSDAPVVMSPEEARRYREVFTGATPFAPDWMGAEEGPRQRQIIGFDFSADEEPCAAWLARETEATFGCERMPPEVGNVLVSDVATNRRDLGEARLYDVLFSDCW